MYFTNKNNFFHGIMFHHFHDDNIHKKSQGSINKDEFYKLINFIGRKNILNADQFFIRYKENKLAEKDICLTFDDSLKSQYDIALPVLEDLKIKSFFFIYSSIFENEPDQLEIYRHFRTNYFSNIDEFYDHFFMKVNKNLNNFFKKNEEQIKIKKKKFSFYSINDLKFRLVRDKLINKEEYKSIMFEMFKKKNFNPKDYYKILFLSKKNVISLKKLGHEIGLHSHSHPTAMEKLPIDQQENEYKENLTYLSKILDCSKNEFKCMSHPSGSYNQDTLKILEGLGVELGFKQMMTVEPEKNMKKINNSFLEIARQDHALIIKSIR
tara:strand:- start:2806 stop:3774 length:969 start_codon:yes stop_codon:yes gene_type:complete